MKTTKNTKPKSESDIQTKICEYLYKRGHFFWRSNNTAIFDRKLGMHRSMGKYALRGVPDIIVLKSGFIGLEVKKPGGKLSSEQLAFKKRVESECGEYHRVTSVDDVKALGL